MLKEWSFNNKECRALYDKVRFKQSKNEIDPHISTIELAKKIWYETQHKRMKALHPQAKPMTPDNRANPDYSTFKYLRALCKNERDNAEHIQFNPQDPSNPTEPHPIIDISVKKKNKRAIDLY